MGWQKLDTWQVYCDACGARGPIVRVSVRECPPTGVPDVMPKGWTTLSGSTPGFAETCCEKCSGQHGPPPNWLDPGNQLIS